MVAISFALVVVVISSSATLLRSSRRRRRRHRRSCAHVSLKVPATVLAVSPAVGDGIVAVGDVSGRITLIRCIGADTCRKPYEKCVSTTLHWHAHGVNTLVFNHDGDYLYSGGEEGVLVSWQLRSGSRSFLPRLGAAVVDVALSPDAKCLAIACASNNIALVDVAASRVVRRVNGLRVAVPPDVTEAAQAAHSNASKSAKLRAEKYQRKQRYKQREAAAAAATLASGDADAADDVVASVVPTRVKAGKPRRAAAGLHVIDGVCVLNGGPNTLQFFDVLEDRHVAELEVARGAAASHMFARPNVFTDAVVEHVAFSPDRLMLVTVDRRSGLDGTIGGTVSSAVRAAGVADDMQLKFWTRNDVNGEFELHTRVEHAHSGPVTRLLFHPASPPMVITASSDGRVRTWVRRDATAAAVSRGKAGVWTCRSTAEHRRGVAASDADLCSDGSLLAVVYGASVTLWSSSRVALLRTLTYPSREQPPLKSARFLAGSTLLATTTDNELHFWDLSSGLVVQSFRIGVAQIAVHPALPLLVVVTKLTEYGNSASLLTSGGGSDSMDDLAATGGDQHESGESSKRMPPLASQHLLLFDPTKRALPQCIYRNVVGFNRRQRRRDVLSPDALVTEIAFAHAAPRCRVKRIVLFVAWRHSDVLAAGRRAGAADCRLGAAVCSVDERGAERVRRASAAEESRCAHDGDGRQRRRARRRRQRGRGRRRERTSGVNGAHVVCDVAECGTAARVRRSVTRSATTVGVGGELFECAAAKRGAGASGERRDGARHGQCVERRWRRARVG
jgi:WD40 repeat protein